MSSAVTTNGSSSTPSRGGRLPRWTRREILTLIEAKQAYEKQWGPGIARPAEPKWTFVSSYCRDRDVERGPLQCRKRWSNLACDFKKVRAWEGKNSSGESEEREKRGSFWLMRSDVRRERKLPGFFDREVFEMMDEEVEEEEAVFDSGRTGREEGLFSDFEEEEEEEEEMLGAAAEMGEPLVVVPISERRYQTENEHSDPGNSNDNQQTDDNNNPEKGSSSWEGQKRRKTSEEETSLENKLIELLEKNSRILSAQLEAQNLNCQLDRDQRKDQNESLLSVMTRLADALGKIAEKL